MKHILFVEDDELIASGLIYALTQEGYQLTHCKDVSSASEELQMRAFDLGLLDLSLPDGTGYTICKLLRERGTPVIFLTAVDDEGNVVRGLEMGAEDYVTKPFRLRELLARIKNVLVRQTPEHPDSIIKIEPSLQIHPAEARVYYNGGEVELTALEYRLLLTLARNRGRVLSRAQLLQAIWDPAGGFVNDNTLSVCVKRLREKLGGDHGHGMEIIQTVRGMGYRLDG